MAEEEGPQWICVNCKHVWRGGDGPNKKCPQCGGRAISRYIVMVSGGRGTDNI